MTERPDPRTFQADADDKLERIVLECRDIVATTEKGRPTGAWQYLRSRGLDPSNLPECIKCRSRAMGKHGAVVALVEDGSGNVVGCQQIFITPNGSKAPADKFTGPGAKRSYGRIKGKVVRLAGSAPEVNYHDQKNNKTYRGVIPIVCEGVETAISVWQAHDGKREVWCTLGVKNIGHVPDPPWSVGATGHKLRARMLAIVADADAEGTDGHNDLIRGIHRLHKRNLGVLLARPDGSGGRDANDVLMEEGSEAVRRLVDGMQADSAQRLRRVGARPGS